jgi:hypothetical protein
MSKKICITYTNATSVPYQGSVLGRHAVLNYIDSNGDHHILQAVPKQKFEHNGDKALAFLREEYVSDGTNNTDSPFGRLWPEGGDVENKDKNVSLRQPHMMVAEGDDLSSRWEAVLAIPIMP